MLSVDARCDVLSICLSLESGLVLSCLVFSFLRVSERCRALSLAILQLAKLTMIIQAVLPCFVL